MIDLEFDGAPDLKEIALVAKECEGAYVCWRRRVLDPGCRYRLTHPGLWQALLRLPLRQFGWVSEKSVGWFKSSSVPTAMHIVFNRPEQGT
jgi:hypothetical protein